MPPVARHNASPRGRPPDRARRFRAIAAGADASLRERYWLRLHVLVIGLFTLAALSAVSWTLMAWGMQSLALRYALALPAAYVVYLVLLRLWAEELVRRGSPLEQLDPGLGADVGAQAIDAAADAPYSSGGGGDFGGGGASGSWVDDAASKAGEITGAAFESADEGAVVLIPVAVITGIALLLAAAFGAGVVAVFGVEALVAVAVEVVLASLAGSWAYKGFAEGWLAAALRHTWKAALALFVAGVALGAAIDHHLPEARSLPHAVQLLSESGR